MTFQGKYSLSVMYLVKALGQWQRRLDSISLCSPSYMWLIEMETGDRNADWRSNELEKTAVSSGTWGDSPLPCSSSSSPILLGSCIVVFFTRDHLHFPPQSLISTCPLLRCPPSSQTLLYSRIQLDCSHPAPSDNPLISSSSHSFQLSSFLPTHLSVFSSFRNIQFFTGRCLCFPDFTLFNRYLQQTLMVFNEFGKKSRVRWSILSAAVYVQEMGCEFVI